jgi:hypothetical protein
VKSEAAGFQKNVAGYKVKQVVLLKNVAVFSGDKNLQKI